MSAARWILAAVFADACGAARPAAPELGNRAAPVVPATQRSLRELSVDREANDRLLAARAVPTAADRRALARVIAPDGGPLLAGLHDAAGSADASAGAVHWLDADRDGVVDLALVDAFYDASPGYLVLVREDRRFRRAWSAPGRFIGFEPSGDHVVLRFEVAVVSGGDPRVIRTLDRDPTTRAWHLGPASYLAVQGVVPPIESCGPIEITTETALRLAPRLDDASLAKRRGEFEGFDETATLRGDVVADYPAGARGVALAERGEWLFVALAAEPVPVATSLRHDLFARSSGNGDVSMPPPHTFYCGWVPRRAVHTPYT
jgi:hypothetical protein